MPRESSPNPHTASIAVWDIPRPVVRGRLFKVHVGVKCASTCRLTGALVRVREDSGSELYEGRLGKTPWPGTMGLYVAEMSLIAPDAGGVSPWSVTFVGDKLGAPHQDAIATFSVRTAKAPEHGVRIHVTERDAGTPLARAHVFMGAYRASTNDRGQAHLELPKGAYELHVRKRGYQMPRQTVQVGKDVTVRIEASRLPERNADEDQVWM